MGEAQYGMTHCLDCLYLREPGNEQGYTHAGNATCNATDSTFYSLAVTTLLAGAGTVAGSGAPSKFSCHVDLYAPARAMRCYECRPGIRELGFGHAPCTALE